MLYEIEALGLSRVYPTRRIMGSGHLTKIVGGGIKEEKVERFKTLEASVSTPKEREQCSQKLLRSELVVMKNHLYSFNGCAYGQ